MAWYEPTRRPPKCGDIGMTHWQDDKRQSGSFDGDDAALPRQHVSDAVDISNYLDERWNYPKRGNMNFLGGDRLQFRVEEHLSSILPSLSNSFASFCSDTFHGGRFRFGNGRTHYHGGHRNSLHSHSGHTTTDENYTSHESIGDNTGDTGKKALPVSKAAQFFHPRPVMALMPYRQFFSPLYFEGYDLDDEGESKTANGESRNQDSDHHVVLSSSAAGHGLGMRGKFQKDTHHTKRIDLLGSNFLNHGQNLSLQKEHDRPAQTRYGEVQHFDNRYKQSNKDSVGAPSIQSSQQEFQYDAVERNGYAALPNRQNPRVRSQDDHSLNHTINTAYADTESNNSSPSHQRPCDLFRAKTNTTSQPAKNETPATTKVSSFLKLFAASKSPPAVQSKITRNLETGQLELSLDQYVAKSDKSKKFDNARNAIDAAPEKKMTNNEPKKAKQKEARTITARQSEVETLLDSMQALRQNKTKKRSSDSNDGYSVKIVKKSKQLPPDDESSIDNYDIDAPQISYEDFEGLEDMNIKNAAACMDGLQEFLGIIGQKSHVVWTMLFLDKHVAQKATTSGTSGKSKSNKKKNDFRRSGKFDLPEKNAAYQISTPFLPTSKKYCTEKGPRCSHWNCTCDSQIRAKRCTAPLLGAMFLFKDDVSDEDCDPLQCYILPLGNCSSDSSSVYVRMRNWPTVPFECDVSLSERWDAFKAILSSKTTKVTYNATVSLLPLYHHLIHDRVKAKHAHDRFDTFRSAISGESNGRWPLAPDECLHSIWDLRLVSWMLRPGVSDAELEYSYFKEGFQHLIPIMQTDNHEGLAVLSRSLLEAKNDLALLDNIFPIMNRQVINNDLLPALEQIEAPVQSILAAMECRGIAFDSSRVEKVQSQLEKRVKTLELLSREITKNPDFLLSSPQQVSNFLFDVLKLSPPTGLVSKTKAGSSHRSTSEETLKAIKAEMISSDGSAHSILDVILEFRTLNKMLTTYILPLPSFCYRDKSNDEFPRIHPHWVQTAARTGRLSCRKPNLQQVPHSNETLQGVDPRNAFVPSKRGTRMLFSCDYSQKEVRILAHMCSDKTLMSLFLDKNHDIYKQMASLVRNKPIESVTSEERSQFKQVTLAILYGMSPKQVAKKLNISETAAVQIMRDFFHKFSGLKKWMEGTKEFARKNHYVLTIAGRRRYLDAISSDDRAQKSQAERQAINTVIQGSAADLMKTAMINMSKNLRKWKGPPSERPQMLLQIHDELILELNFDENHIYWLKEIALKSCCGDCEKCFGLKIPLVLDCSCGLSWQSMKPV